MATPGSGQSFNCKTWPGPVPERCDVCNKKLAVEFYDFRTQLGAWAFACPTCFTIHGSGLGVGKGTRYIVPQACV
jgi:hypothetical protein